MVMEQRRNSISDSWALGKTAGFSGFVASFEFSHQETIFCQNTPRRIRRHQVLVINK